jgi:hypothetical protein
MCANVAHNFQTILLQLIRARTCNSIVLLAGHDSYIRCTFNSTLSRVYYVKEREQLWFRKNINTFQQVA